jgi:hypothetical protein
MEEFFTKNIVNGKNPLYIVSTAKVRPHKGEYVRLDGAITKIKTVLPISKEEVGLYIERK